MSRLFVSAAVVVVAAIAAPAASAEARGPVLRLAEAERAARATVAPLAVESVVCVRPAARPSGSDRRRAVCLVTHPAPPGRHRQSLVEVKAVRRGYRGVRARVVHRTHNP